MSTTATYYIKTAAAERRAPKIAFELLISCKRSQTVVGRDKQSRRRGGGGVGSITMQHSGWGLRFIAYDDDCWKDLLVAKGHVLPKIELTYPRLSYREPMMLARNNGKKFVGGFTRVRR